MRVAALTDGGYVVTWKSQVPNENGFGAYSIRIHAQRYDASGNPAGGETTVNSLVPDYYGISPTVAGLADGGYVVAWESFGQTSSLGINAQRFDAAGSPVGAEQRVNTSQTYVQQTSPAITALSDGYVVTWQSSSESDIYAQRYDANSNRLGEEVRVNTTTVDSQLSPAITSLADGGYVVAWLGATWGPDGDGVFSQRYDRNGNSVGGENRVSTTIANAPALAALADGGYVVIWNRSFQAYSDIEIFAQRYDSGGNPVGFETLVNKTTAGDQRAAAIAALPDGGYQIVWASDGQDGSGWGIYGQRFAPRGGTVHQLAGDATANRLTWTGSIGFSLDGAAGNDTVNGGLGADTLTGGLGNDSLDGGSGIDIAAYTGARSTYTVVKVGAGYTVTDTNAADGDEGSDTLVGIERLQFSDQTIALGVTARDYNGDGKSDIVFRATGSGALLHHQKDGFATTSAAWLPVMQDPNWAVVGNGDYNGDGKSDILLGNATTGGLIQYQMNGSAVSAAAWIGSPGAGFKVVGNGDYNGDGKTDILFRINANGALLHAPDERLRHRQRRLAAHHARPRLERGRQRRLQRRRQERHPAGQRHHRRPHREYQMNGTASSAAPPGSAAPAPASRSSATATTTATARATSCSARIPRADC